MPLPSSALTSTEAATWVLRKLGELGADEEAEASDVTLVRQCHQGVYNEWYMRLIATWPFEQTPPEALNGFLGVVVARMRPFFQGTTVVETQAEESAAERAYFMGNPQAELSGGTRAEFF